jgi:hypothetical protein
MAATLLFHILKQDYPRKINLFIEGLWTTKFQESLF